MDQLRLFTGRQPDKKLNRKFKTMIRKYRKHCSVYGYKSGDPGTLINFLHSKGYRTGKELIHNNGSYNFIYQGKAYDLQELIYLFKNGG